MTKRTSRKKPPKDTGKKPGAQPGNKNAEKHGFYSKHFSKDESIRLADTDRMSIEGEIDLIRVYIDRLASIVSAKDKLSDDDLKALNTLSLMTQSISTMIRTHYLTRGKGGVIESTIMEALEELRLEMGL